MIENKTEFPLVSILIVTFNAEKHLEACLASIAAQTYPALEVVIIDGKSTDRTVDIIKNYTHIVQFWLSEPDKGIYDAMNKGLKYITGDWVYFLGADDTLLPDFSKMLLHEVRDDRYIYYGNTLFKNEKYKGYLNRYRQAKHGFNHQTMIYPAKVFKKYSYNTKYKISADRMLNIDCMNDTNFEFKYVDYIIARFNDTGVSTLYEDPVFEKEKYRIVFKNFGFLIGIRFLIKGFKDKFIRRN
jgi:glycosyltransferase involved in cell wall biosynthesis